MIRNHSISFSMPVALLVLFGSAACAADAAGAEQREAAAEPATEKKEEVTIAVDDLAAFGIASAPVQRQVVAEPIVAPGWATYDPQGEAQVSVQAAGRIVRIAVTVGAQVQAGEVLAEVICPDFVAAQNAWLLKRSALATAALVIEQAVAAVTRGEQSGEAISKAELQRRAFEVTLARQAALTATTELAAARNTLRLLGGDGFDFEGLAKTGEAVQTLALRAPLAGQVVDLPAVVGQNVGVDSGPVATIADATRLWVVVQIPEGTAVEVEAGCPVELSGLGGLRLSAGTVTQVTPEIDAHTHAARARIAVASAAALRPGMYVQAAIVPRRARAGAPVLAVPEASVVMLGGRSVVFIEERADGKVVFRPRPVTIGAVQGGQAPVLSGVAAGEAVVVQGAFLLKADLGKDSVGEEE